MKGLSEFESFTQFISPWVEAYRLATISYVAINMIDQSPLLMGRIFLEPTTISVDTNTFTYKSTTVIAERFSIDLNNDKRKKLFNDTRNGHISCASNSENIQLRAENGLHSIFSPIRPPLTSEDLSALRVPSVLLTGSNRRELFPNFDPNLIDWELSSSETPFQDFNELLALCGFPTWQNWGDMATLEVIAKPPAMISDTSSMSDGKAVVQCRMASSLDLKKLRIGYKVLAEKQIERGSKKGEDADIKYKDDVAIATWTLDTGSAPFMQAFANYNNIAHHRWWITDLTKTRNLRQLIHEVFDHDNQLLRQMLLDPDTNKPYSFENAVTTLLYLLGFSVTGYGHIPKLQNGPDVVAFTNAGHILAVECTIGILNKNNKLAKLAQRVALIRRGLVENERSYIRVQPVIVTPLSRDEILADIDTAGKQGISVVCKEELEAVLVRTSLVPNSDAVYEEICRLIPPVPQQPDLLP